MSGNEIYDYQPRPAAETDSLDLAEAGSDESERLDVEQLLADSWQAQLAELGAENSWQAEAAAISQAGEEFSADLTALFDLDDIGDSGEVSDPVAAELVDWDPESLSGVFVWRVDPTPAKKKPGLNLNGNGAPLEISRAFKAGQTGTETSFSVDANPGNVLKSYPVEFSELSELWRAYDESVQFSASRGLTGIFVIGLILVSLLFLLLLAVAAITELIS